MGDKPIAWVGASLSDLRAFPDDAKRRTGYQLRRLQLGLLPDDWKPVGMIGPGVQEIRIHSGREYRVLYIAKFAEGVYVLHAFEKRSQQIRKADIDLARQRYHDLIRHRRKEPEIP